MSSLFITLLIFIIVHYRFSFFPITILLRIVNTLYAVLCILLQLIAFHVAQILNPLKIQDPKITLSEVKFKTTQCLHSKLILIKMARNDDTNQRSMVGLQCNYEQD